MTSSYRKRFLWQIAESELTSIQVAIKRRNLVNPIKSAAPLSRVFDPERHNLIVHLNRKNVASGSLFDRVDVVCNKEVTPDRSFGENCRQKQSTKSPLRTHSLDRDRQRHLRQRRNGAVTTHASDQSSDESEVGSPRIFRKNSNPKCCRDLFLQDELKSKRSSNRNSKSRSSRERGDPSHEAENRPSTSGYSRRNRRSRSNQSQSADSIERPVNVHHKQRGDKEQRQNRTEFEDNEGQVRYKSSKHRYPSGSEHSSHVRRSSKFKERQTRSRSNSSGNRQRGLENRSRSRSLSEDTNNKRTSKRSKSISTRRTSYRSSRSTRFSRSRSRSRSLTPLRPGEYRPGKRKRLDSSHSINRKSTSSSRRSDQYQQQQQQYHQHHRQYRPIALADYSAHIPMPYQPFQPMFNPPGGGPPRGYPPRSMLPHPHQLAQYIQYVPMPALYQPMSTPAAAAGTAAQSLPPRPPKVYNNRPIPHFGAATVRFISTAASTTAADGPTSTTTATATISNTTLTDDSCVSVASIVTAASTDSTVDVQQRYSAIDTDTLEDPINAVHKQSS